MLDPTRYLNLLHLFTPFLLLLPTVTLFAPNPPRLEEPEGIRPITIQRIIPRRGWIISLLCILAFTTVLDAAVSVGIIILAGKYGRSSEVEGLGLASWIVYPVGGLIVWAAAAGASEWRARWHDRGIKALAVLAFICEVPNLVLLVDRVTRATGTWNTITILSIPPSGLRLLVLPLLLIIAFKPIIRYEPVNDTEDVEADGDPAASSSSSARQTLHTPAQNKFPPEGAASTPNGAATPAVSAKPSIVIPKKLGEVKRDERVLTWAEVWVRMKKVWPYLWPSTSLKLQFFTVLTILLVLLGRAFTPLQPIIFGQLVRALTSVSAGIPTPSLWPLFISYFSIRTVSSTLIWFLRSLLFTPVTQYTDREMQLLCFNHLLNLSLAYHTRRNTGEVLKIIDRGSAINSLFQSILFTIAPAVIDIIVGFAVFWVLFGGVLVALTTVIMVLYVWVSIVQTQARVATRRQLSDKDVKQRGIVSDVLTNWESVKYFTAEQREVKRFREALLDYQVTEWKWSLNWQTLYLWQQGLLALGLVAGSLIIAIRVRDGEMDATELIVFLQYFSALSSPLSNLGTMYAQLNRNSIDAEKMLSLLAEATEVNDKPGAKDLIVTDGVVEFDDVVFSYDGKLDALKGVSFKIDKGTSMALVGESGSGKSTILRLLYRFYDIKSGVIRIDGQDISEVTQLSLRRAIGIVPQDSVLWNDTIGANVSYGREGATDEEIIEASRAARLHDKIMGFKEEYATIVGERGIRLSGGEKQRVSLARMFLKSPAILVLDEATSALDTETEREIQRGLTELAKGRTSLSIAHRLSTIINSDQIVVMKDGKVIENGTYKELLDADAAFATMWKNQIFTDAERLALAQGSSSNSQAGSLIELEGNEQDDLIDLEQTGEGNDTLVAGAETNEEVPDDPANSEAGPSASSPQSPSTIKVAPRSPVTDSASAEGYSTEPAEEPVPATYADAVTSTEPTAPHVPPPHDATGTIVEDSGPIDQPGPEVAESSTAEADPTETRQPEPLIDPQRRVSFPPVSEPMSRSESTASRDSAPLLSRQSTGPLNDDNAQTRKTSDPETKRKRLSSLKGFVRRISDQGVSRSTSARSVSGSSKGGGMGGLDEEAAEAPKEESKDKRKKRLSIRRDQ